MGVKAQEGWECGSEGPRGMGLWERGPKRYGNVGVRAQEGWD